VKITKNDTVGFGQLWSKPAGYLFLYGPQAKNVFVVVVLFTFKMVEKIQTGMLFCNT